MRFVDLRKIEKDTRRRLRRLALVLDHGRRDLCAFDDYGQVYEPAHHARAVFVERIDGLRREMAARAV